MDNNIFTVNPYFFSFLYELNIFLKSNLAVSQIDWHHVRSIISAIAEMKSISLHMLTKCG